MFESQPATSSSQSTHTPLPRRTLSFPRGNPMPCKVTSSPGSQEHDYVFKPPRVPFPRFLGRTAQLAAQKARDASLRRPRVSASTLPPDILREVLMLAQQDAPILPDWPHRFSTRMTAARVLSHVCRIWRATALNTTTLWTTVLITDTLSNIDLVQLYVERSGSRPLDLCFVASMKLQPLLTTTRIVREHTARWRIVRIYCRVAVALYKMVTLLGREFPILEILELGAQGVKYKTAVGVTLPNAFSAPKLRDLILNGAPAVIPASVNALPGLKRLSLHCSGFTQCFTSGLAMVGIHRISMAAPNLRVLSLTSPASFQLTRTSPAAPRVLMPSLTELHLFLDLPQVSAVLAALTAPLLHTLRLVQSRGAAVPPTPSELAKHFPMLKRLEFADAPSTVFWWLSMFPQAGREFVFHAADFARLCFHVGAGDVHQLQELTVCGHEYDLIRLRVALTSIGAFESLLALELRTLYRPEGELWDWFAKNVKSFKWEKWQKGDDHDRIGLKMA